MNQQLWGYILTALSSGVVVKLVEYLLFRKKNSAQSKSAEVKATEDAFEALQKQVEHLKKSLDDAYITTRKMQSVIDEFRNLNIDLTKELAAAQIELAKAQARTNGCNGCSDKI